jgi:hypothetical protein
MTQEEFEKLLQKKCPWHLGANHAAIDCYHLRRTFSNSSGGKKDKKPMNKEPEDDDQGDQGRNPKFQDASKTVNVIFGGMETLVLGGNKNCFSERSCPASRWHHDHSAGWRCPSHSHEMISGQAFRSPVSSPWF